MMCLGAIINVGIQSIVVGATDSPMGALRLLPHGQYYRAKGSTLQLTTGFVADECQALLDEYVRRTGHRTHLAVKR